MKIYKFFGFMRSYFTDFVGSCLLIFIYISQFVWFVNVHILDEGWFLSWIWGNYQGQHLWTCLFFFLFLHDYSVLKLSKSCSSECRSDLFTAFKKKTRKIRIKHWFLKSWAEMKFFSSSSVQFIPYLLTEFDLLGMKEKNVDLSGT